jgi:hypothetical protein
MSSGFQGEISEYRHLTFPSPEKGAGIKARTALRVLPSFCYLTLADNRKPRPLSIWRPATDPGEYRYQSFLTSLDRVGGPSGHDFGSK